ncbi:T9SS type A sorting domain-containing protein [Chryseobacterium viscerum]|uniref:T9SS type A sorting domain-containing protein n=1 Tax=Chryseobacterium viscerum TaxID=1037377 RepID=A0A5N4BQZ3_9FLAO|nr:T9SS type A sorting domain-containing protein [Chryseobacterium viscerum]KAB1230833.1 T9SS type A sorting domain-containing protein [Chryseobacterium viscerum]
MRQLKNKLWGLLLILPALSFSQTYQWQWGKQAGGQVGSADGGFNYQYDESIRDIVVDNNNNTYYLTSVWDGDQNLNGVSVPNYGLRDLMLFATDCQGNVLWSTTIGGSGDGENAWHIEVDNNGGLYVMATLYNNSYVGDSSAVPMHFDGTHTMPLYTYYDQTIDPAHKAAYLLKYNTSNGNLAWSKALQGDINYSTRDCDVQMMYMDSSKNIHAVMGFKAGTHLDGLITVPSSYTSSFQYYLVKFNYNNGSMTPVAPLLLPITGGLRAGGTDGKVNLLYDESLNRYYLAGKRMIGNYGTAMESFSYNNIPFTKNAYVLAFNGTTGAELWRKEFDNSLPGFMDDEIHSVIKGSGSSDIYISGRYFSGTVPTTFGSYSFPVQNYQGQTPFVMKLNADGVVQWAKVPDGLTSFSAYRFMKGKIALNGNELGFAKGSFNEVWGSFSMTRPNSDLSDPLLVRFNKDTGAVIGTGEIHSNFQVQDEFTAIAVDKDGNYVLGGLFHDQLFTDSNDNVNTMTVNVMGGKSQSFITKYAKSACSQMSVEETAVQAGIQLFPNPVQDVLTIRSKEPLVSYEIFGATGQLVKQGTLKMMQEQVVLSSLQTGVYYIKLKTKSSTVTEKILKK